MSVEGAVNDQYYRYAERRWLQLKPVRCRVSLTTGQKETMRVCVRREGRGGEKCILPTSIQPDIFNELGDTLQSQDLFSVKVDHQWVIIQH